MWAHNKWETFFISFHEMLKRRMGQIETISLVLLNRRKSELPTALATQRQKLTGRKSKSVSKRLEQFLWCGDHERGLGIFFFFFNIPKQKKLTLKLKLNYISYVSAVPLC